MKTRFVTHVALNKKGEKVGFLVCCSGQLMTVKEWKALQKSMNGAIRFYRATMIGEAKE